MREILIIVSAIFLVPISFIGLVIVLETRGLKKELAAEDAEQLIPLQIHGSRVMLTDAEYTAHLDDQLDTADTWVTKLLRDTKD